MGTNVLLSLDTSKYPRKIIHTIFEEYGVLSSITCPHSYNAYLKNDNVDVLMMMIHVGISLNC